MFLPSVFQQLRLEAPWKIVSTFWSVSLALVFPFLVQYSFFSEALWNIIFFLFAHSFHRSYCFSCLFSKLFLLPSTFIRLLSNRSIPHRLLTMFLTSFSYFFRRSPLQSSFSLHNFQCVMYPALESRDLGERPLTYLAGHFSVNEDDMT